MRSIRNIVFYRYMLTTLVAFLLCARAMAAQPDFDISEYWKDYRAKYPFLHQELVISSDLGDGIRYLVVSEPPPHELLEDQDKLFGQIFGPSYVRYEKFHHPVGVDGWVTDIGVVLDVSGRVDQLDSQLLALNRTLFKTDYKAYVRDFDRMPWVRTMPVRGVLGPPDLKVSAASLNKWLFQDALVFNGADKDYSGNLKQILDSKQVGLFHSQPSGLVVATLPRNDDLGKDGYYALLRQFALDTDSVLGGVIVGSATDRTGVLALVGRERSTSLEVLPPLRVETILTLAATRESELAQSYERMAVYAGKGSDLKDWAPIYLSHDLTDTEFGQLLNITDQLLKGWSESGLMTYENFHYPEPAQFPYQAGLLRTLNTGQVTYNWNTSGFGYMVPFGGIEILAVQRTGALPISYIPGGVDETTSDPSAAAAREAEEIYWDFFAQTRDPNLHRAAEYTALYQIFRRFPVEAKRTEPLSPGYADRNKSLENIVGNTLAALQRNDAIEKLRASNAQVCKSEVLIGEAESETLSEENILKLREYVNFLKELDSKFLIRLEKALVDRQSLFPPDDKITAEVQSHIRRIFSSSSEEEIMTGLISLKPDMREHVLNFHALLISAEFSKFVEYGADCDQVRASLVESRNAFDGRYMKTPTIVLSSRDGIYGQFITGGHNLWSATTEVLPDAAVAKGKVVLEDGVVKLNPDDIGNAGAISRFFARDGKKFDLELPSSRAEFITAMEALLKTVPQDIRAMVPAIELKSLETGAARGLTAVDLPPQARFVGWGSKGLTTAEMDLLRNEAKRTGADIYLSKGSDGYIVFHASGKPPMAFNVPLAADAQLKLEGLVIRTAASKGEDAGMVVIGASDKLSAGELEGMRASAALRSAGGSGEGGGGGGGGFFKFFEDGKEPRKPFWFSSARREAARDPDLQIFDLAKDTPRTLKLLRRTDVDWSAAKVIDFAERNLMPHGQTISFKIELPFVVKAEPRLGVKVRAFFKRLLSKDEKEKLLDRAKVIASGPGTDSIADRITVLRNGLRDDLGADIRLNFRIELTGGDLFIVQDDRGDKSRT